jgi:acyl-CoA dehydrogenase
MPNEMDEFPTGSWQLPEEFVLLRETVRKFVESEVRPLEERLPHDSAGVPEPGLAMLQSRARELGLWSLATPTRFGGAGLSVLGQVVVAEEAAKCRLGAYFPAGGAFGGNPPSVMFSASAEQFERYARPIVEGRMPKAFTAISEASGGSDPARAIHCRAERDGDEYVVNGTKMWTSHAGTADWGVVYARTGAAGDRDGITASSSSGTPRG